MHFELWYLNFEKPPQTGRFLVTPPIKMGCRFARLHGTCAGAWFHHRLILHTQNPVTPPIKMGCRFARLHGTCAGAWFHHRLILHTQNPVTPPIKMGCRHRCRQRKFLRVGLGPPPVHHSFPGPGFLRPTK